MAKSITSYKKMRMVNHNILVVEFHTLYHKDTKGKTIDYRRARVKFKDGVDKNVWKKLRMMRPLSTIIELPNNCEDWVYSEIYVRHSVKA